MRRSGKIREKSVNFVGGQGKILHVLDSATVAVILFKARGVICILRLFQLDFIIYFAIFKLMYK